ncbi:hypothetical protein D9M70_531120 [compost metagenome]
MEMAQRALTFELQTRVCLRPTNECVPAFPACETAIDQGQLRQRRRLARCETFDRHSKTYRQATRIKLWRALCSKLQCGLRRFGKPRMQADTERQSCLTIVADAERYAKAVRQNA